MAPLGEDEWDDDTRAVMDRVGSLNIFTTVARHPELLRRWLRFGTHVLVKSTLPARERELVILRTGARCDSEYEFGQHTVIGAAEGLTPDEIAQLATEEPQGFSAEDTLLIRAVDQLVDDRDVDDETWDELTRRWDEREVLDLLFTVGQYTLVSTVLRTLRVPLDEGVPGWPSSSPASS